MLLYDLVSCHIAQRGRSAQTLELSQQEHEQLESYTRSRSLSSELSNRFRIILLAADETGVPHATVNRVWRAFEFKPHLRETFKLPIDPFFIEKVRDIVGMYMNPPDNATILCVDEKRQCQALERTQPCLPLGFGYAEGYTHDYICHGTLTPFAALDVTADSVIARQRKRYRHQEFLQFLRHIDVNVPLELDVHVIMDNYATHKYENVRVRFAKKPRCHIHFTPTYSSWLNHIEMWFGIITRKAIHRGSFRNVKDLAKKNRFFH
jgi:putative transposase